MKKLLSVVIAAAVLAAFPLACDLQTTGSQIQAEKIMVATILGTPPIDISASAIAGVDGGSFDAGALPDDAGITFDGGTVTLPPQTAAFVFFGERDNSSLDTPPEPLNGATVTVTAEGGTAFTLNAAGDGNYELTSQDDETFEYKSGANYTFTVVLQGETYTGRVEEAPQIERVEALHPPSGYIDHTANAPFTLTRPPAPSGQTRNIGFATVFPVSESGERGEHTWTNIPDSPLEFLQIVAVPGKWRKDTIEVPGSAFPQPKMTYVLVMQAVKLGSAESANLFKGSGIFAGTAEVGIFRTK